MVSVRHEVRRWDPNEGSSVGSVVYDTADFRDVGCGALAEDERDGGPGIVLGKWD